MERALPTQGTKALIKSLSDANAVMMKKKPAPKKTTTGKKKK